MACLPYLAYGVITDTDATNPNGAKVVLRNDTNGETTTTTTNSSGQYVLDAGNLASGYLQTDRITIYCAWGLADGEDNFLISDDTHEVDITLTTVEDSADVTYCTIQDVLDELDDKTTDDISYNRVRKTILRAEAEIDERSGTKFTSNTETDEIHDLNQYTSYKSPDQLQVYRSDIAVGTRNDSMNASFNDRIILKKSPLISVTSLYKNNAGKSSADNWNLLTENTGSGGDFLIDTSITAITFVNNYPTFGMRRIKITYTYGHATVPKTVERLCILLSVRDILASKSSGSTFDSVDSISLEGIAIRKGTGVTVNYFNWLNHEIERLWTIVGDLVVSGA